MKIFIASIVIIFLLAGCEASYTPDKIKPYTEPIPEPEPIPEVIPREWTFVVYMAADNNLEAAAIADFNELEGIDLAGQRVSILALLDRGPGYDATNGDWTDTRLYEITTDPGGNNATIISKRLDCPEMGLSAASNTELDMADPLVLSQLLDYAKRVYSADNYGLLVWGHGTGWKGSGTAGGQIPEPMKAVAIDDTNGSTYMQLKSFGTAVKNKGLKVVGFDTCFGALLELAYQIRGDAAYLVGSEGLIPSNGWDYTSLFTSFLLSSLSPSDFCESAIDQFSAQYSGTLNAAISMIDLAEIDNLVDTFEDFSLVLTAAITAGNKTTVRDAILTGSTIERYYDTPPSDLYIDIESFGEAMSGLLSVDASALQGALDSAVPKSWPKKGSADRHKLGIYVIGLTGVGVPMGSHDPGYIKGSSSMGKSAFVERSNYWVPHFNPAPPTSVLDKLFYW
ncbi:hypothetical protein AGMMS49942_23280 [Spirochaetia bacterium]|nr:hypothetical protein AGMMS49942_23280 [Spirochaetia bacterium]